MSVKNAARKLGISQATLYRLIHSGTIPYLKRGIKGYRVDPLVILEMGKYDPNANPIYRVYNER